jgi:hypothetical protein
MVCASLKERLDGLNVVASKLDELNTVRLTYRADDDFVPAAAALGAASISTCIDV